MEATSSSVMWCVMMWLGWMTGESDLIRMEGDGQWIFSWLLTSQQICDSLSVLSSGCHCIPQPRSLPVCKGSRQACLHPLCDVSTILSCYNPIQKYSGISIYLPRNVCFPVFTVRHLWSWIKFHINNIISASIVPRTVVFPHLSLVNHGPDTVFPAWIFSHGLFEKKNWSELFMWDPCCTPATHVADCMYVYSLPVFICVTFSSLPTWPSVSSHRY
jgi:hypothetical protein